MNIIEAIAQYLEDNGIGTQGTDLFIGELPLDVNNCVSVISSPSPAPDKAVPYYIQTVDVWARFADAQDGYNKLFAVLDLIHRAASYDMDAFHIYLSYAQGSIDDMDRDSENRKLYKLTLGFIYRAEDAS